MRVLNKLVVSTIVLLVAVGPTYAKEWRGLVPLHSTGAGVLRLFNRCSDQREARRFTRDTDKGPNCHSEEVAIGSYTKRRTALRRIGAPFIPTARDKSSRFMSSSPRPDHSFLRVLLFTLGISEPVKDNCERCSQNFGTDCYYGLAKEYLEIQEFEMFWVDALDRPNLNFRGAAYINKNFHKFEGILKGNRLSFAVPLPEGFIYRFDGRFLPGGRTEKTGLIAIDGRLIKLNHSKAVAARNVKLAVRCGSNQ